MANAREVTFDYRAVPTIQRFSESPARLRGLMGPFGSGKSSGCVMEIAARAFAQAPSKRDGRRRTRWAVVRNTYPMLRDTTIKTWFDWFPPDVWGSWHANDHRYVLKAQDVEAEVLFRALDRPADVRNLLSLELTGAWLNEARELDLAVVQGIMGRIGRFPAKRDGGPTWWGVFADTNPPDTDHWWFRLFEKEKRPDIELFRQPSGVSTEAENLPNLPPTYYHDLLAVNSEDWCRVHVHGEYGFVQSGKPVYVDYKDSVHCTAEARYVPGWKVYRGWDFGLTPACVLTHLTPSGVWVVFREVVADNLGVDRFSDQVLGVMAREFPGADCEDIGDPAGSSRAQTDERSCFELLRAKGINITPGEQSVTLRLESVRKPLATMVEGRPGFALHPQCETLRAGFNGKYAFRRMQTAEEKFHDVPDKNSYSHAHDALQYVGTRLFGQGLRTSPMNTPPDRYRRRPFGGVESWLTA